MSTTMTMTSSAFVCGQPIPREFTGEGADISPPLQWEHSPQVTREFALICDDPDAPTSQPWVHWLIYNLLPDTHSLPEHIPRTPRLATPVTACQGCNSWPKGENIGYLGPMPPRGHGVHHYHFRLYALDTALNLPPGIDKARLLDAMDDHILAMAEIMGTYERK